MRLKHLAVTSALLATSVTSAPALAQATTMIDIAGHAVPVMKDGLYDRYRSNPPLPVIEAADPALDLSWFKTMKKTRADVGFETYSPNFYYRNSSITAVFTADLERLKELMPAAVMRQVRPVQVWPGRGLVALTAYAYRYCDNDSYNEISLSVVTSAPGATHWGPFTLLGQSMSGSFWGYVLKLPVNTELARVRGVVGYNLPKWLTAIDFRDGEKTVAFDIADAATGKTDVVFEAEKLAKLSSEPVLVTNNFTNLDRDQQATHGYAVSRKMLHGTSTDADTVRLTLGDGSLSTYIKSLKLGKMLRYEYTPEFQSALYAPEPLGAKH